MQHDRGFLAAVGIDIGQLELGRQAEVELAGRKGVLRPDSRLDVDVELRAVEGGLADLLGELDAELVSTLAQSALGVFPHRVVVVVLLLVVGVAQREHAAVIGDVEILVDIEDQVADVCDLALDLVGASQTGGRHSGRNAARARCP